MQQLLLDQDEGWRILDMASGPNSHWPMAQVKCDQRDYSKRYPKHQFDRCMASQTPYKDKEFDFVVAGHIAEHVEDPAAFIAELMRIGKRGYIEVPTPLFDNLVIGNPEVHHWWVTFDDVEESLVFVKRIDVLRQHIDFIELELIQPFFRCSIVTELYWEDDIKWRYDEPIFQDGRVKVDLRDGKKITPWLLGQQTMRNLKRG